MTIHSRARTAGLLVLGLLALLVSLVGAQDAPPPTDAPLSVDGQVAPKWSIALPTTSCSWSASEHNCHASSPGVGDLDRDGRLDIVAATNNGHVVAVSDGSIPVSYTHLDVYKRQIPTRPARTWFGRWRYGTIAGAPSTGLATRPGWMPTATSTRRTS